MKKSLLTIIPAILIGLFLGYILTPTKDKDYIREIEHQKKQYVQSIKEIQVLKKRLASHDSVWTEIVQLHKDSLRSERITTNRLRNENTRLKNRPVPDWSSADLDSLLNMIVE